MIYLDVEELLHVAERVVEDVAVRDLGLLAAAASRPRAGAFGEDAYPTLHEKAAALVHAVARHRALVDGNKRLALAAALAFYGVNGYHLRMTNDEAHELIMAVAAGDIDEVRDIAAVLRRHTAPRGSGAGAAD